MRIVVDDRGLISSDYPENTTISINKPLIVNSSASFNGPLVLSSSLNLTGSLSLSGDLNLVGNFITTGSIFSTGNLSISSSINVTGSSTLNTLNVLGNSALVGTLNVTGSTILSSSLVVRGNTTLTGTLAINDDLTLAANKKITNATDLILNAPTTRAIIGSINDSERVRITPSGGFTVGTSTDPGAGKILITNSGSYSVLDNAGTARNLLFVAAGTNDVALGSTAWSSVTIDSNGGGSTVLNNGGTLNTRAVFSQLQLFRGLKVTYRAVADTNATLAITDVILGFTSLSAARTVTLPSAVTVGGGALFTVADESGNCSGVNTITLNTVSSQKFNSAVSTSYAISSSYGSITFYSNGTLWKTYATS